MMGRHDAESGVQLGYTHMRQGLGEGGSGYERRWKREGRYVRCRRGCMGTAWKRVWMGWFPCVWRREKKMVTKREEVVVAVEGSTRVAYLRGGVCDGAEEEEVVAIGWRRRGGCWL